jgi:hypothetical protein
MNDVTSVRRPNFSDPRYRAATGITTSVDVDVTTRAAR